MIKETSMINYIYKTSMKVSGEFGLWTIPETRSDRISYSIPTYSGMLGLVKNTFWKPEIGVDVLRVKILKTPRRHATGLNHMHKDTSIRLSTQSYITYPEYLVEIGLYQVIEGNVKEMANKYSNMLNRAIKAGGRRHVCIGCSECKAIVEPFNTSWEDVPSELIGTRHFGHMYHHHNPVTNKKYFIEDCVVVDGILDFSTQVIVEV